VRWELLETPGGKLSGVAGGVNGGRTLQAAPLILRVLNRAGQPEQGYLVLRILLYRLDQ
jgi:hypothetical protein